MTQQPRIPDAETRKREVCQLSETVRQLDAFILSLDGAIAIADAGLREQRRARLEARCILTD